jgi:hypothetical protein
MVRGPARVPKKDKMTFKNKQTIVSPRCFDNFSVQIDNKVLNRTLNCFDKLVFVAVIILYPLLPV